MKFSLVLGSVVLTALLASGAHAQGTPRSSDGSVPGSRIGSVSPKPATEAPAEEPGPVEVDDLIDTSDRDEILDIARRFGEAEFITIGEGEQAIRGTTDGRGYLVRFMNCDAGPICEDILFYSYFDIDLGLEKVNDWNATQRFSRAYIDAEQDTVLENDLDLAVPATPAYVHQAFAVWRFMLGRFAEFVSE